MTSEWLNHFWKIINYMIGYMTVNLGRGVFFSFALLLLVMLLRKLPPFRDCFLRMILWGCFLWLPFIGGLKFFYETSCGVRGFLWWAYWNYEHSVIGQIYFLVMALYGGYLFYRKKKLHCFLSKLKRLRENIYICEDMVTPFTTGLFRPKIVVPEAMLREYAAEELETILLHEKKHIRLGHLWCLFLWDVLRVLLWPNVLLTFCMRPLKADLEEICDRVTIQSSGKSACDYGMLLLKCIRLLYPLRGKKVPAAGSAAFAGESGRNDYKDMKRRIQKISAFRQYRMRSVILILIAGLLLVGGGFLGIHECSYARYTELEDITILDDTGIQVILQDSERLRATVTFDKQRVFVDVPEMLEMLEESGSRTEGIYILFGGFMKQPGVGGGGDMVYMELSELAGEQAEIAYETNQDLLVWIVKML